MFIKKLILRCFRNYEYLDLDIHSNTSIFIGGNAEGKTSILEAIHFLALTKSHKTFYDNEAININSKYANIQALVYKNDSKNILDIIIKKKGKNIKVNDKEYKKISDYIGNINVILFSPEDLDLIKGSPNIRRRFLDMTLSQLYSSYIHYLNQYNEILKQRNELLKQHQQSNDKDYTLLDIITKQLIDFNIQIYNKRLEFVNKLNKYANDKQLILSNKCEDLNINYINNFNNLSDKKSLFELFKTNYEKDVYRGSTSIGIHRDDVQFFINEFNVQTYGSQGQQRTTVLSLKLALINYFKDDIGENPILLLDDVLSELDADRQSLLIDIIDDDIQTFITSTDIYGIKNDILSKAELFVVKGAKVTRKGDSNV